MKCFILLLAVFSRITLVASVDCSKAPTDALRVVCQQLQRWDEESRKTPAPTLVMPPAIVGKVQIAADFAPIVSTIYQCMTIACLCGFFRGTGGDSCTVQGRPLRKALRKEYRQLSDEERNRVHSAFRTLKDSGEFDRLAAVHAQFATSGGAHSGPAFLPWHREFIKRVEIALRQVDPELALPYWDSTLDENMPNSKDSVIWTNEFMGETTAGSVSSGPFRNWRTLEAHPNIRRDVGAKGKCFSEDEVQFMLSLSDITQVLAATAPRPGCPFQSNFNALEYTHGNVHIYVGGDMFDTPTSANDPIFYMHHAFVDYIWEMHRQSKQSRSERERAWPPNNEQCASQHHFSNAFMRPFPPMRNTDGLSNMYTDNLYTFSPRPSCSMGDNCGSPYLYCDKSHGLPRCASKIKPGGSCAGLANGENACYNGICTNGRCVAESIQVTPPPPIAPAEPVVVANQACFNEHECCSYWAGIGECPKNHLYMNEWCKASCRVCQPNYDLNNECQDRHMNCVSWARGGECIRNPLWMAENCRSVCGKCSTNKSFACSGGGSNAIQVQNTQPPTTQSPPPTPSRPQTVGGGAQLHCDSPMCYNEDQCCPVWAFEGECSKNPGFMLCHCRVSCLQCLPNYVYGACADYHSECFKWMHTGECAKNKWMLENCRKSCQSCANGNVLRQICPRRLARAVFLTSIGM